MRQVLAILIPTVCALTACSSAVSPDGEHTGTTRDDLMGAVTGDSTCHQPDVDQAQKGAFFGRTLSASPAVRTCVADALARRIVWPTFPSGHGGVVIGPYKACSSDPVPTNAPVVFNAIQSPNDVSLSCDYSNPNGSTAANAPIGVHDSLNREAFTLVNRASLFDTTQRACWEPGTGACFDDTTFGEFAGILWHEALHVQGWNHMEYGNSVRDNDCGLTQEPATYYGYSVNYIVGECMRGVVEYSVANCGGEIVRPHGLQLISGLDANDNPLTTCAFVADPNATDPIMAWRGAGSDTAIWWSGFNGSSWSGQQAIPNRATDAAPALARNNAGQVVMAWRGAGSDNHIWWSQFDGISWSEQQLLDDRRTDLSPALGLDSSGRLVMAWRGAGTDTIIWWSQFNGSSWSGQQALTDRGTDAAPALAQGNGGQLLMAWRGAGTDNHIWWSQFNGSSWSGGQPLNDRRTDVAPALGLDSSGRLSMAWRGTGSDTTIWWSQFNGGSWSGQQPLTDRATDAAPALARGNAGQLLMGWRGAGSDNHIWWSQLDGGSWSRPFPLNDRRTDVAPAIGGSPN